MTHEDTCAKCDWFEPNPNNATFGWCKRNEPQLIGTRKVPDGKLIGIFQNPTTAATSFCSHWSGD